MDTAHTYINTDDTKNIKCKSYMSGQELCLHQAVKSNFARIWPWPFNPKVNNFMFLASKSFHLFSEYLVHQFGNEWTDGQTDRSTT